MISPIPEFTASILVMEPAASPTPNCVAVPPTVVNAASPDALEVDVPPKPEVRIFAFFVHPT